MEMKLAKVTFIGLGKMGSILAKRILQAGFDLTVYNRTESKMLPLIEAGAKGAHSAQEAVQEADVVVTCLLDDHAVFDMVKGDAGFITSLKPNAIHIGTSTILPSTSKTLSYLHQTNSNVYLAGNVLGIPKVAERGELTSIVAGHAEAIAICMPLFQTYSAKIINVGESPFKANVMKICSNYLLATVIEAVGEIYTFAEKSELENEIIQAFLHQVFAHPAYKLYVDKIKERNFDDVNFELSGGFKDLHLFQQAFTDVRVVPHIANIIKDKLLIAMAHGMEHKDWSAVTEITRLEAGLDSE